MICADMNIQEHRGEIMDAEVGHSPVNAAEMPGHGDHRSKMPKNDAHDHGAGHCCGHAHAMSQNPDEDISDGASDSRAVYIIPNMDCPMEEALIRKRLKSVPGITGLEFNLMQRVLVVDHEPGDDGAIVDALKSIDMIPEKVRAKRVEIKSAEIPWKKLTVAGIFAALSEFVELCHEWGYSFLGLNLSGASFGGLEAGSWVSLALALAAIILGGLVTYRKGWLAISNFRLNINALMAVAVTGAVLIGQFPEAAMVMVLFNISEAIEALALDRSRKAIKELMDLAPQTATLRMPDGSWKEMGADKIQPGDIVRVAPGEKVAGDGEIVSGSSFLNQAPITGESMPVEKQPGDFVYGGSINESGSFEFRATTAATDTTLARIIEAVEKAQATRAPMQRFVDVFAQFYTPAIFLLALLWAIGAPLLFGRPWLESVYTGLVILVIGCPCALVISTPVTMVSAMSAATKNGVLVKGGLFMEQARRMNWLALDKTGTLTTGVPTLVEIRVFGEMPAESGERIAASLAARSDHPVSRALWNAAQEKGIHLEEVTDFSALPGMGVMGRIGGVTWHLGNLRLMKSMNVESVPLEEQIVELENDGKTVVALAGKKGIVAIFAVADTIRQSSREAIRLLENMGIKTLMLTGDNAHTAAAIAREAGVAMFRAELLPEDKLEIIEDLERRGQMTGMVGDGINDAPALAKADISYAMAEGGTDTAMETADIAIMDDDLRKIPALVKLSKATNIILIENISLALSIKAFFFVITLMGMATMWMAVFADVGAALIVVANGIRARGKFPALVAPGAAGNDQNKYQIK